MDEGTRHKYEQKAQELRVELKRFESDWAKKHNGKKPGHDDIKKNPIIAHRYKKYNQVRDVLSGKAPPPREPNKLRKRKTEGNHSETPSKRARPEVTPSNSRYFDAGSENLETPSTRKLFSPAIPTSIGPTPQRDGRVLGLFDLLDETNEKTPSRRRNSGPSLSEAKVQATPSRRRNGDAEIEQDSAIKLGRTPTSTSKQVILDTFKTPLKNRDGNSQGAKTPSSVSKLQFATPAFLRRAPLPTVDENGEWKSPEPIRLPRKPLGRGLSSVVASLRKLEEEQLDDDLEALHEMENDSALSRPARPTKAKDDVLVPDSQAQHLLSGFDDEAQLDREPEEQPGRDGRPLKIYKKKAPKRSTRLVNMRPTRAKRPSHGTDNDDSESDGGDVVPETQIDITKASGEPVEIDAGSEFDGSDFEDDAEPKEKKSTKKAPKQGGALKKAARKVNELAHANFRRLKLKNHGAKGGPGFGSRFRRRR